MFCRIEWLKTVLSFSKTAESFMQGEYGGYHGDVTAEQLEGRLITPGFVDIHCHSALDLIGYEEPAKVASHFLQHGSTSMLLSLYRDLWPDVAMEALKRIREAMQVCPNLLGIHLEGPYMHPNYGNDSGQSTLGEPNPEEYLPFMESGLVKQWTFAPEMPGTDAFLADLCRYGIVPAIGHSEASPEDVQRVCRNGVRLVTHIMAATGTAITPTRYAGTKEVSFDEATLLENNLYYEIILDKTGIHVRHDMARLILKTVGVDRVVGITDSVRRSPDSLDDEVNIIDDCVNGSMMAMDNVARNFYNLGLSLSDVFKVVSLNPATVLHMEDAIGSLEPGKKADILVMAKELQIERVYKEGHQMR